MLSFLTATARGGYAAALGDICLGIPIFRVCLAGARTGLESHETNVSTESPEAEACTRISVPNEDESGSRGDQPTASKGSQAPDGLRRI